MDKALQLIDEGLKLVPEESEFLVLKIFAYYGQMANQIELSAELYPKTLQLSEQAKTFNADNPRIYLLNGQAVFHMPEEYGGGKEKAKEILLVAKEKYEIYKMPDPLLIDWGKESCEQMLEECE